MKKLLVMLLCLTMALSLVACGDNGDGKESNPPAGSDGTNPPETQGAQNPPASGDTVALTVWGGEEDQTLLSQLADEFKAAHPDVKLEITVGVESESTAKDTILTDPQAAADVFAFASDQLDALVNAKAIQSLDDMDPALQALAGTSVADVKAANSAGSIEGATRNGVLYAFPMTAGNNYFLCYDPDALTEDQVKSWDSLLDAAQAQGKKVAMTIASGWYNASFFYAAGFTTGLNDDGTTSIDWNGTSSKGIKGVDVVKAMQAIASHPAFFATNDLPAAITSGDVIAVVDGTWEGKALAQGFGDNYAATTLPTFTLNGEQVQQYCVSGFKFVGVNPYSKQTGWAAALAEFITNEQSQVKRFEQRSAAPTNNNAAANPAVVENTLIAASSKQDAYGIVQLVGDNYWSPTESFGAQIAQGTIGTDDAAIQSALDSLVTGVTAPLA